VTSYFARQLAPSLQVYYIPNAIDENFFNLTSTANGNTILFAGRVIPRKRVLDLVQAFVRLAPDFPKIQLRIAGECESEPAYVDSIRGLIKKFGLEGRVHLLGQLSEADILAEFARSDLFVLPSAQETTPMVIAQAMAAGKPVIATAVGGVAEMVSYGKTGFLIKVDNQDELANAMQSLIQDSSLRAQMGRAGHEVALQKYHLDTVAKQTYEVYKMMLKA
jgi:glycosyltransferase involved in cell wall biosynthesis